MENSIKNLKTLETFIFVHSQDIILDFIKKKRFNNFDKLTYVFVGNRPTDKIKHFENVVICKNLKYNVEQYPNLTSYTGWYALIKNNLITTDYVNLFEYDINYVDNFVDLNTNIINEMPDIIGYLPMQITDPVYIQWDNLVKNLIDSIKAHTKVDVINVIDEIKQKYKNAVWSSSSNSTWKTDTLKMYVEWFHQFVPDIVTSKYCGHMHERSISFFYYIHKIKTYIANNLIFHLQLNSHQTSDNLNKNRFNTAYNQLK